MKKERKTERRKEMKKERNKKERKGGRRNPVSLCSVHPVVAAKSSTHSARATQLLHS